MIADEQTPPPLHLDDEDGDDGDGAILLGVTYNGADDRHRNMSICLDADATADEQAEQLLRTVQAMALHVGPELAAAVMRRLAP